MTGAGMLISPEFWGCFCVFAVVDRFAHGVLPRRAAYALTVAASLGFVWRFAGVDATHLAALLASLVAVHAAATRSAGAGGGMLPRLGLVAAGVALLWSLGKVGSSLDLGVLSWLFFVGASFLAVKIWTFLKDLHDGRIEDPDLAAFLAYCLFFPAFISGPMHYFGEFRTAFEERTPVHAQAVVDNGFRVLHGLVKVLVVATILRPFSLDVLRESGLSEVGIVDLGVRCVVYSLVLYLDFSGYSDVAIGAGGFLGVRIPENFRMPYLAPNLREFWQRWHITFTRFLTQYMFVPLVRHLQRTREWSAATVSAAGYFTTFLFCGFWHGSTPNFVLWGAFHAAGLAGYDIYRTRRMDAARAARRPLAPPSGPTRALVTAGTFAFVSLAWLLFVLPLEFWTR